MGVDGSVKPGTTGSWVPEVAMISGVDRSADFGKSMFTGERMSKFEIKGSLAEPLGMVLALRGGRRSSSDSGGLCSTGPFPTLMMTLWMRPRRAGGMRLSSSMELPPAANCAIEEGASWITRYIERSAESVPQPILHSGAVPRGSWGSMLLETISGFGSDSFLGAGRSSSG